MFRTSNRFVCSKTSDDLHQSDYQSLICTADSTKNIWHSISEKKNKAFPLIINLHHYTTFENVVAYSTFAKFKLVEARSNFNLCIKNSCNCPIASSVDRNVTLVS